MNIKQCIFLTSAVLSITASTAQAVQRMTDATFSAPVNNQRELLTFEQNSGGTTFEIVAIGTTTTGAGNNSGLGWNGGGNGSVGTNVGRSKNQAEAMNDLFVTTNGFSVPDDIDFTFETTVNDGDGQIFYLVEHLGNDTTLVEPLDTNGDVIAGWSFTITPRNYAPITDLSIYDWNDEPHALAGTTFSLADFSGGSGTLTGVGGLRIDGAGQLDLAQVGVGGPRTNGGGHLDLAQTDVVDEIPEASAALLIGGLGMLTLLRRRIK